MPLYNYRCSCGAVVELERPYENRKGPVACPVCIEGWAEYEFSAAYIGTERKRGDNRIIKDERELENRWRDQGTTGKPGGAGKVLTFDQGSGR